MEPYSGIKTTPCGALPSTWQSPPSIPIFSRGRHNQDILPWKPLLTGRKHCNQILPLPPLFIRLPVPQSRITNHDSGTPPVLRRTDLCCEIAATAFYQRDEIWLHGGITPGERCWGDTGVCGNTPDATGAYTVAAGGVVGDIST